MLYLAAALDSHWRRSTCKTYGSGVVRIDSPDSPPRALGREPSWRHRFQNPIRPPRGRAAAPIATGDQRCSAHAPARIPPDMSLHSQAPSRAADVAGLRDKSAPPHALSPLSIDSLGHRRVRSRRIGPEGRSRFEVIRPRGRVL